MYVAIRGKRSADDLYIINLGAGNHLVLVYKWSSPPRKEIPFSEKRLFKFVKDDTIQIITLVPAI